MLSRVAESIFWMSRYMERAENTARFLDVHFHLLLDLNRVSADAVPTNEWEPLVLVTSDWIYFQEKIGQYDAATVTQYLVFDQTNSNSIYSCVALARENARSIIQSISSEMWEQVNNLYHFLQKATLASVENDPYTFYQEVKNGVHLFHGIMENTLSRHEGWHFLQAGRYLERADNTARLLDVKCQLLGVNENDHQESTDVIQWMAVLKSCSALEAFRKVYLAKIEPGSIVDYLVLDRAFPRSIYVCISAIEEALWKISGGSRHNYANNADRLVGQMMAELSYLTVNDIYERGVSIFLADLQGRLAKIGNQVHQIYFAYHIPDTEHYNYNASTALTSLRGTRAAWSQAEKQQQQQQQQQCHTLKRRPA